MTSSPVSSATTSPAGKKAHKLEVLPLVWGNIPHIEPQVMTPTEFERSVAENRFFVTQEILKHGKIIYEKKN